MKQHKFQLIADYSASGDQPQAIQKLVDAYQKDVNRLCLMGVTGSGKTYTMASFIATIHRPTLVLTHNKTLAAQLYREFRQFFPKNAVEYFVSYYNYYQPEAYVPTSDTYIEKDASVNDEIDRLRLRATSALLERKDVVIVASVSCIYGLGSPEDYRHSLVIIEQGVEIDRNQILRQLLHIQYQRNDIEIARGTFRVRGDVLEIFPAYREEGIRVEWFGEEIERISLIHPITGVILHELERVVIYPARHFITSPLHLKQAISDIKMELEESIQGFEAQKKPLEAQRIAFRTRFDIEMLEEMGYCNGIENYSRHLTRRLPGTPPACLLDYFDSEFVVIIDESHVSIPQIRGMYEGDRSRKQTLVDHGFRLPSALDNRPLNFTEFQQLAKKVLYVSATPSDYELQESQVVVEQIIRPTGLLDPLVEVRPTKNQIEDLAKEINLRVEKKERVLVTTLTKVMSEDLTDYLQDLGMKVVYLHSDVQTIDRVEIIRDLRQGKYDVLVGVNLLREGLDIPEVSLVTILDADKEGFLRNARSLIQTIGRAARNANGHAILYANTVTQSMQTAIDETLRRRELQMEYNQKHKITPQTIRKEVLDIIERDYVGEYEQELAEQIEKEIQFPSDVTQKQKLDTLRQAMLQAAEELNFERAALLRDYMQRLTGNGNTSKTVTKKINRKGIVIPLRGKQKQEKKSFGKQFNKVFTAKGKTGPRMKITKKKYR